MAYTLNQLRAQRKTSIHGRRLGLDANDFLVGPVGVRLPHDDIDQTGTGTSVPYYGMTRIISSANGGSTQAGLAYTIQAPPGPGVEKEIYHYGASTSAHVFGFSGSAVVQGGSLTSAGSTMISFFRQNAYVKLRSISSAIWLALNTKSSAGASSDMFGISFSATLSS